MSASPFVKLIECFCTRIVRFYAALSCGIVHASNVDNGELDSEVWCYVTYAAEHVLKAASADRHVLQQVLSKFDGSKWVYQVTKPVSPKLGQSAREPIPSLAPPVRMMPGMIAAQHALRTEA